LASEKRSLLVGQVATETLREDEIVKLSRKGIVEILDVSASKIELLAVRSGILVVSIEDSFGVVRRKIVFDVKKAPQPSQNKDFLGGAQNTAFVCNHQRRVRCIKQRFLVEGRSSDVSWFYRAKRLCETHGPCVFDVIFEEEGRAALNEKLKKEANIYVIDIASDGRIHLTLDCSYWTKDRIRNLLASFQWREHFLSTECGFDPRQYRIKVRASTGRRVENHLVKPWMKTGLSTSVWGVEAEKSHSYSHVISEPEFWLAPNKSVEISHGLEIPVQSSSDDASQYWRRLGFNLEIAILEMKEQNLLITYHISLSEPSHSGGRVYSAGMKSQAWVRLGKRETLGYLTTKSESQGEKSHALFSTIPIIGPLFRNKASNDGSARIRVDIEAALQRSSSQIKAMEIHQ
jgi:hypothetical protein